MGSHQWAERHQFWQVNPLFHYQGDLRDREPIGSSKWFCWRERRRDKRVDWESVRKRADWNLQIIKWLVHQTRPWLSAKVSAVKLEAIGPEEKDKELDVLHLEHVTYTPAPPGLKREETDPSVHTWISDGGREDSLLEAEWSRAVLLPVQSGIKGETVKWVVVHGGKGGHMIRVSLWDGSGCVAEEQNDLQEGFFFSRQETFLVARA